MDLFSFSNTNSVLIKDMDFITFESLKYKGHADYVKYLYISAEGCNETLICHSSGLGNGRVPHTPWSQHGNECQYACLYKEEVV